MNTPRAELDTILEWAKAKLAEGQEPPWSWYQLMKLRETLEAIHAGMAATTTVSSQQSAEPSGKHLRLVDSTCQPDTSQPHHVGLPTRPPM